MQQMVLRDQYVQNPANEDFQWALTEIADECRHSIMFAWFCEKLDVPAYYPTRASVELGRGFKTLATAEAAYAGILVAEEVLDIIQRDLMRDERVLPLARKVSQFSTGLRGGAGGRTWGNLPRRFQLKEPARASKSESRI